MNDQQMPLVLNENSETCPDCHSAKNIFAYYYYRDGGSEVYCGTCCNKRWPNLKHPRGREKAMALGWIPPVPDGFSVVTAPTDPDPGIGEALTFAHAADVTRKLWEGLGYRVHVQTNDKRVTITKAS